METIIVVGCETVVGANVAATHAEKHRVLAVSNGDPSDIAGCESRCCRGFERGAIRALVLEERPSRIIFCGAGARSSWEDRDSTALHCEDSIEAWAGAALDLACKLTLISSDAVFTGPWMFHEEQCAALCQSEQAQHIRRTEKIATDIVPDAFVARTHAFGWSTGHGETGWLESCLDVLEAGAPNHFDYIRHATPILATHLSEILEQAHRQGLSGTHHIAGAERINPAQFASRLALHFDLPQPQLATRSSLTRRPEGFGRAETSLQTRKIRAALDVTLPMLTESLDQLAGQVASGYRDRLRSTEDALHGNAA